MLPYRLLMRADHWLARTESFVAILLTAMLTLLIMAQVILRYFFNAPLFWAEEIAVQMLVFITLIGTSLLVQQGALVCIDFLPRALSPKGQHLLAAALGVAFLVLLGFLAMLAWEWIRRPDVHLEIGATTRLPRWYNYSALPGAMLAMAFHQFAGVVHHLMDVREVQA